VSIHIETEAFTGPFDLLLNLISEEQVDIYSVSISRITDNYLSALDQMRENRLNVGSEFLLLATTLLELKSRSLLPAELLLDDPSESVEDARMSLLDRLVEYKRYKELSEDLLVRNEFFDQIFFRDVAVRATKAEMNIIPKVDIVGASLDKLSKAFEELWRKQLLEDTEKTEIVKDTITVRDKISAILDILGTERCVTFSQLFTEQSTRVDIIVTFLALLEIVKRQLVNIVQVGIYEDITIERSWGELEPLAYGN